MSRWNLQKKCCAFSSLCFVWWFALGCLFWSQTKPPRAPPGGMRGEGTEKEKEKENVVEREKGGGDGE